MKKNFFKYMLLGAFTLALGVGFVGCKDYDDDIDILNKSLAEAQTKLTALQASIDAKADKTAVESSIAAAKTAVIAETKKMIEDAIAGIGDPGNPENIAARLAALELQVEGLTAGDLQKQKALLDLQQKALVDYGFVDDEGQASFEAAMKALQGAQKALGELTPEELEQLGELIENVQPLLNLLTGVESMITGVGGADLGSTLPANPTDFNFGTVTATASVVFGQGTDSPITFTEGEIVGTQLDQYTVLSVTPTNAKLTAAQVSLVDSKGNDDINDFIKVASVTAYDELITRAVPSSNGLWKVSFALVDGVDIEDVDEVAYTEAGVPIGFAIAVENKLSSAERFVRTEYTYAVLSKGAQQWWMIDVDLEQGTIGRPNYSFANLDANVVLNKYNIVKDSVWNIPQSRNQVPKTKNLDDRSATSGGSAFNVRVGEAFSVTLLEQDPTTIGYNNYGPSVFPYAYYVTFDDTRATTAVLAQWKSYGITGIDQMHFWSPEDKIEIMVPSTVGNGKEIGFNIFAVNQNGQVMDPGGKQFWIETVEQGTPPVDPVGSLQFTLTPNKYVFDPEPAANLTPAEVAAGDNRMSGRVFATNKVAYNPTAGLNAAEIDLIKGVNLTLEGLEYDVPVLIGYDGNNTPKDNPVMAEPKVNFFASNGTTAVTALNDPTELVKIRQVQIANLIPSNFMMDELYPLAPLTAILEFVDANGDRLFAKNIEITKKDVTFPSSFKVNALYASAVNNGKLTIVYNQATTPNYANWNEVAQTKNFSDIFDGTEGMTFATQDPNNAKITIAGTGATATFTPTTDTKDAFTKEVGLKVSYDFGYYLYYDDGGTRPSSYVADWAAENRVTTFTLKSSVQVAANFIWKTNNWIIDNTGTPTTNPNYNVMAADETRSYFPFRADATGDGTTSVTLGGIDAGVSKGGLKAYNPSTNLPFDLFYSNAATPVTIEDPNIQSITPFLIAEGTTWHKDNNNSNPYFNVALPAGAIGDALALSVTAKATPVTSISEYAMTLVLRVKDQFGNETNWLSPAGTFKGVLALEQKVTELP